MTTKDCFEKWLERNEKPLAELRSKNMVEIYNLKQKAPTGGVAIGISPADSVLDNHSEMEITKLIYKIVSKMRSRGSDGALVPIAPLDLYIVGEYSPKHRWHYHGIIKVTNIEILNKIKKKLSHMIGRTVTEQIKHEPNYIDYMYKQYTDIDNGYFFEWDRQKCYLHYEQYHKLDVPLEI